MNITNNIAKFSSFNLDNLCANNHPNLESERANNQQKRFGLRKLDAVNYSQFRTHIKRTDMGDVKRRGNQTRLFNRRGELIAVIIAAAIDKQGRITPLQYFAYKPSSQDIKLAA